MSSLLRASVLRTCSHELDIHCNAEPIACMTGPRIILLRACSNDLDLHSDGMTAAEHAAVEQQMKDPYANLGKAGGCAISSNLLHEKGMKGVNKNARGGQLQCIAGYALSRVTEYPTMPTIHS
eukprot:1138035-Pelagomonas_calceolata.AAC.3